jgi:Tfp pilus assembly protein PilF
MANAVQLVLQTDLSTSRALIPSLAGDDSGTFLVGAKEVLRTTLTLRRSGLHLTATFTDNSTQKVERAVELQASGSTNLLPLLNALAKQIDSNSTVFSTKNDRALQAYLKAASTNQMQQRVTGLRDALSIDPAFGLAYITLAEVDAQAAPADLQGLLQTAGSRESSFTPFDRARLNALRVRYSHGPLREQESALQAVLQIAPNQPDALVGLGTLGFLSGSATVGTRYFERAMALNPGNPTVLRAYAEGLIETRQFARAEKILVGLDNNLAVLPELAVCVLLQGDAPRANAVAARLFASIPNPDLKSLYQGVWLQLSGQTAKANDLLTSTKFAQPASQAIAYSELSMWQMIAHNFASARSWAAKAQQIDPRPGTFGSIVGLLVGADGPADHWRQQVDASFLAANQPLKEQALGYGFFLGAHYAEAEQTWNAILQRSGGADLRARAMLAAAGRQEGKTDAARALNVQPFVPEFGDLYASVSFFEMNRDLGIGVR